MKPIVGSLFSGIGGIDLAFQRAGFEIAFQVEIDPYCQKVLGKHWPNVQRFEDVKNVGKRNLPIVDVLAGGFPCFAAGTLILTITGYKPVESLSVGELVLTHTGAWQPITAVMCREAKSTRIVSGHGFYPLQTTDEHPFYIRQRKLEWNSETHRYERLFASPQWVEARQLDNASFVGQVLPPISDDAHSTEYWWVIGRYLADGWRVSRKGRKTGRVVICCAKSESAYLKQKIGNAGFHPILASDRTTDKYHILNADLYHALGSFGHLAHGKTLPGWVLSLPVAKASALLEGYLSGDGSQYKDKNGVYAGWRTTSVSKSLTLGIAALAQRAWGVVAALHSASVAETTVIEGRIVNQRPQYSAQIPNRNRSAFVEGDYGWKLVKHNSVADGTAVYNISVSGDESYMANGAIVHNCQDISIAGKGAGIVEGNRSGLWFEFARIIGELRPRVVFLENVPAITTNGGTLVIGQLAALGYDAEWGVVPAATVGTPHRRDRWFCVAYTNRFGHSKSATRNADTDSQRNDSSSKQGWISNDHAPNTSAEAVGDTHSFSTQGKWTLLQSVMDSRYGARQHQSTGSNNRFGEIDQPQLAGIFDGLSIRVDGSHRWPASFGIQQYDWEPPRTVARGVIPDWKARVKALGNAVVPQVIEPFARVILSYLNDTKTANQPVIKNTEMETK